MKESQAARKRRMRAVSTLAGAAELLRIYNRPDLARQVDEVTDGIYTDPNYGKPIR